MFTADECREKAKLKMAISELDIKNRRKHVKAAGAWLYLAEKMENPAPIGWVE